ncbi:MAG: TIGR04372 family glycosyltransferase [Candidatus Omnitrophota bacterium]|nr:TIGR04372 family glycosyltransferase [Candidatus Omnitrophota bacterium]
MKDIGQGPIRKLYQCLLVPPAVLIAIGIRILRPLIVVRWGRIDIARIGGIYRADWYLSLYHGRMCRDKYFDIFYFDWSGVVGNSQWWAMWKRVLRIFPFGGLAKLVGRISCILPGDKLYIVPVMDATPSTISEHQDILKRILEHKEPNVAFTPQEEHFGHQEIRGLGIPEKAPFVCFHARDAAYLDAVYPDRSWGYHDYRDSNIFNYLPAVEGLARRGYHAVRMGSTVKDRLPASNAAIIDYAANGSRTDFLDVYLGAKCHSFLCSDTGMSIIPEAFKRPVVYVNWVPIQRISIWVSNGIFIFKKFYSVSKKRCLTFSEIIQSGLGNCWDGRDFEKNEIELRENSPEEIMAPVFEMEDRLKGKWKAGPEDEELQRRFWACLGWDNLNPNVRIGAEFLRQNQDLLN